MTLFTFIETKKKKKSGKRLICSFGDFFSRKGVYGSTMSKYGKV